MNQNLTQAAYVHLPFCRQRCFYCDFPIAVVGPQQNLEQANWVKEYVEVLCQEIQSLTPGKLVPLTSVFFGGGTPSLLPVADLALILQTLERSLGFDSAIEISLEIDPGTFNLQRLQSYQALGVNRLSLGVQSFADDLLAGCGRHHRYADIERALEDLNRCSFPNWSLDLIAGLPQQTLCHWEDSLSQAIAAGPTHISCYDLVLEANTALGKTMKPETAPLPVGDTTAAMYELAHHQLSQAGFEHYEISNYARPGFTCRHNLVYWHNQPYYGFGLGATSYVGGVRITRPRTRQAYYHWVCQLPHSYTGEITSGKEQSLETLMLGLRLAPGVAIAAIPNLTRPEQEKLLEILLPSAQTGLVALVGADGAVWWEKPPGGWQEVTTVRLTVPRGFMLSNQVLGHIFAHL
jgi:oxygen-independent coproporphyrinogen-3 oxidase